MHVCYTIVNTPPLKLLSASVVQLLLYWPLIPSNLGSEHLLHSTFLTISTVPYNFHLSPYLLPSITRNTACLNKCHTNTAVREQLPSIIICKTRSYHLLYSKHFPHIKYHEYCKGRRSALPVIYPTSSVVAIIFIELY